MHISRSLKRSFMGLGLCAKGMLVGTSSEAAAANVEARDRPFIAASLGFLVREPSLVYGCETFDLYLCTQSKAIRSNGASGREPVLLEVSRVDLIH